MAGEALPRSDFYVYEHWRPDRGVCFWVGKGNGPRAYRFTRNSHYDRIVAKLASLGIEVEVRMVAVGLSEDGAFALEKERIAFWRGIGSDLANKTDGGEGPTGLKFTAESIAKIRSARLAQVFSDADRAKHLAAMKSPETKARMSAAAKARPSTSFLGRTHSEETKAKWSVARKGAVLTPEHRANISKGLYVNNGFRGKHHTPETRAKISQHNLTRDLSHFNFKGGRHTEEAKQKIGDANRGKVLSPETKAKMGASKRGRPLSAEHRAKLSATKQAKRRERTRLANEASGQGQLDHA